MSADDSRSINVHIIEAVDWYKRSTNLEVAHGGTLVAFWCSDTNLLDAVIVQTIAKKYKKHLRKECFNYRQSLLYNKWEVEAEKDFGDIWYDDEVMKRTDMMVSIVMKMKQTAGCGWWQSWWWRQCARGTNYNYSGHFWEWHFVTMVGMPAGMALPILPVSVV